LLPRRLPRLRRLLPHPPCPPRLGRFTHPLRQLQRPSRQRPHRPATTPPRCWPSTKRRPTPRVRAGAIPSCGPTPPPKFWSPTLTSIMATPSVAHLFASLLHRRRAITPPSEVPLRVARHEREISDSVAHSPSRPLTKSRMHDSGGGSG